jgi:hypothetical protein
LDAWGEGAYGSNVRDLRGQLKEATTLFRRSVDHLKEQDDRALVDYYAADLADMAVYLLTSWLALGDASLGERKRELARAYIGQAMPRFHGRLAALRAADPTPLRARDLILDGGR